MLTPLEIFGGEANEPGDSLAIKGLRSLINGGSLPKEGVWKNGNLYTLQPLTLPVSGSSCGPGGVTTDLYVWLRADKEAFNTGTTDATDGQTVATWNDQSTTDTDATSDGNAPTFKNNSTDNINFNPVLDFDGVNDRMTFGNLANIKSGATNGGDYTFVAVGIRQSGLGYLIGSPGGANDQDLHFGYRSSTVLTLDHFGNGFNSIISAYDDPAQTPFLILGDYDGTNRSLEEIRDGTLSSTTNSNTTDLSGSRPSYLGQESGAEYNGLIAEVIIYDNNISATDKNKIYSYLAIKYGIELDDTGGGTNGDYMSAAGTTLWDASANSTYHHDIAGIGRDDDSELNQKQSKSANTDAIVSMGLGSIATTNSANSNSFSADNSFMLWGNDNAATTQASANTSDLPAGGITERMSRVWKVAETGTVGNVEIQFDLTGLGYGTSLNDFKLIVSNSATMASGTLTDASSINGDVVTFSSVDLSDGQFFSLATKKGAPGGVNTDLYVWLKASEEAYNTGTTPATDGQTVATWNDQSSTDTDATSDGNPPLFKNNSADNINFNPTLDFDGTNDRLTFGNLANIKSGATNGGDYTLVAVGIRQSGAGYLMGSPGGTNDQDLHFGYRSSGVLTLDHFGNGFNLFVNNYDNPDETPFVILGEYDGTTRFLEEVRDGALTSITNSNSTDLSGSRTNYIGLFGSYYNGLISEIIIYDNDISDTNKDKIYSYLAIKYGIELDNAGGGTAGDYTNAAGTTLWDASANSTYHNDIAGIGRDDDSELDQRQSKSANTDAIVSMGLGSIATTNSANSNSFSADNSFMLWGNDNAATAQASANTSDLPSTILERMSRVWKVAETGTVGNVEIQFDLTGLGYGTTLDDFHLIVSSSATMASGTLTAASSINSNVVSFTGVDLSDGQFFSLATKMEAPGAVSQDLSLWLKADVGTNTTTGGAGVTSWNDQGGEAQNASGTGDAKYKVNWSNDNPAVSFTNDLEAMTGTINRSNGGGSSLFMVGDFSSSTSMPLMSFFFNSTVNHNLWNNNYSTNPPGAINFSFQSGQPGLWGAIDPGNANDAFVYENGGDKATMTNNLFTQWTNATYRLGQQGTLALNTGHIAEVIFYDKQLSATERQKVESYLAIKYGIELDNTGGGTAGDYTNAAGTTLWDASANSSYHNDIAGIGRDDDSALNQKQSKSANSDAIVHIGLGSIAATNAANSNSFSADNSFMLWGNDNAATTQASANTSDLPSTILERMSRVWKVVETGTVGNVEIQFDLTGLGYGTTLDDFHLIVSSSATMASGTLTAASSINSNVVSFTEVDLSDGQFFSLATKMEAPGAVSQDLSLWLKANTGTNTITQGAGITSWNDLGGEAHNATGTGDAKYNTNWSNGNPAVEFTNDVDAITGTINRGNGGGSSLFVVGEFSSSTSMPLMSFTFSGLTNHSLWNKNYSTNPVGQVNFTFQSGQPGLWGAIDPGNANDAFVYENGADKATMTNNLFTQWTTATYRLAQHSTFPLDNGQIAEVIFYDKQLSATERQKVESYLALKYGIELDNTAGGTAGDYINAASTTLWDASANSAYHNDVVGIGRDDDSALNQKQSKSANNDAIVSMGLGGIAATNSANSNSFSADNSFMLWGNDNAATAQASANTADLPSTVLERMSRVWKVVETGTVGNVEIQFDLTGLGYSTTLDDFNLIVSSSATMASGTLTAASSINSNVVSFTGVDLTNGQFFSLATKMEAPGAVSQDLSLWLKADAGTNTTMQGAGVTSWNDLGGEAQNATGTGDAVYNTNWTNFNPAINFTDDDDPITGSINRTNGTASTLFVVGDFTTTTGNAFFTIQTEFSLWQRRYANNANNYLLGIDQPLIVTASDVGGTANAIIHKDGDEFYTYSSKFENTDWTSETYILGDLGNANDGFRLEGHIAEVVYYDRQISITDQQKVEGYLAIKYGITLGTDNDGDGTPLESGTIEEGDYVNSQGTAIWDASANSTYHYDVAGVGRDDDSALNQKQSKSANTDAIVSIGLGSVAATNAANSNSFSADNSFMLWGNDNAATDQANANTSDLPSTILERMSRVWKVQETGTVGNVEIQFDLTGLGYGTTLDNFQLIISNTSTMASGTLTAASSINSNVVSFTGIDLSNGQFFSLATKMEAPGGVNTDLYVWLKADAGTSTTTDNTTLSTWSDQSSTATDATSDGNPPLYKNNSTDNINFNPTIDFDGTDDRLSLGNLANIKSGAANGGDYTLLAIGIRQDGSHNYVIGTQGGTPDEDLQFGYRISDTQLGLAHWSNDLNLSVNAYNNPAETPFLILGEYDGTNRFLEETRDGALSNTTAGNTTDVAGSRTNYIGDVASLGNYNGLISEVIVYDNDITDTDKTKLYSYLALKYGIELDNTGGGTNGDYINATGTTLWDASANSTYHNDVVGIGRDDDSALDQKQSKSANTDAIVSIGLGGLAATNTANANNFSADNSFMIWGNDNAATAQASANTADLPVTALERVSRVWKVAETGTVGNVEIQFDLTGLGYGTTLDDFHLIVSSSATMASGTLTAAASINSNVVSFTGVDLSDGQFFSLATKMEAPGGVTTDLYVWLKADAGTSTTTDNTTLTTWSDQSSTATDAISDGNPPLYKNNSIDNINFNPTIDFDGIDDRLSLGNLANIKSGATNGGDYTLVAVGVRQSAIGYLIGSPGGVDHQDLHFGYRSTSVLTLDHWANVINLSVNAYDNPAETPYVILGEYDGTTRFLEEVRNGTLTSATQNNSTDLSGSRTNYVGFQSGFSNGLISEVIIYDNDISDTHKDKIYSYLAIKYGIELDNTGGGTNGDYTNAAGTTLWDASANSTYHNDIAGIGRDDDSGLNQKQSKSASTDAIVSMGLGSIATTNSANSNSFSADNSFMLWGNDNAAPAQASANTSDLPANTLERISRIWKVAETGTVGNVEIQFDLTGLGYGNTLGDFKLIVSNTATMASGTLTRASSINGNVVSFTGVDLTNGQFFSLATKMEAPGGVTTDLYVWLKADAGTSTTTDNTTLTTWSDQSTAGTDATSDGNPPLYKNNSTDNINFNPTIDFDGTDDRLSLGNLANIKSGAANNGDYTLLGVGIRQDAGHNYIIGSVFVPVNEGLHIGYRNSNTSLALGHIGNDFELPVNGYNDPGETPFLIFGEHDGTNRFLEEVRNGTLSSKSNSVTLDVEGSQTTYIGLTNTFFYNGLISEFIIYDNDIADTDKNKLYSYLALKYGIELDNTGGGTNGDYINAAGTTFWDASAHSTYHNNVAGIGRDDDSALNQKQSKSANSDAIVSVGLDDDTDGLESTNADNPSSFSANSSFLMWGHDGAALTDRNENIDMDPLLVKSQLNREWKVRETGTVGSVVVQFDISAIAGPTGIGTNDESQIVLLVDNDGDFSSGASKVFQSFVTPGDDLVNFVVDFSDGQFFTLGSSEYLALPITLLSFEATARKDHIRINWATANEQNNSVFKIERSGSDLDFDVIGSIEGVGNSQDISHYEFIDYSPLEGQSYYRLVDIDIHGRRNISKIVKILFRPPRQVIPPYPNPVKQGELLFIPGTEQEDTEVLVYHNSGMVKSIQHFNRNTSGYLKTHTLQPGLYIIRVKTRGVYRTHKIIVQKN